MPDVKLRMTYNSIASLYEKARPSYPEDLFNLVLDYSKLKSGHNILDIGCGTGKGIFPFLKRGCSAYCIDIGAEMISEAKSVLSGFENISFEVVKFEDWVTNQKFDLIICASVFHWLEFNKRFLKIAHLLNPGGTLAIFKNDNVLHNNDFSLMQEKIYRKHIPEWFESNFSDFDMNYNQKEIGIELFTMPIEKIIYWESKYTANEYVDLLSTYSGHINLPSEKRDKLLFDIKELISNDFNGCIIKKWKTELILRRRYA